MRDATLRQLQIFAALGKHLSFTRAAEELRLTQPAISMQVQALERIAGLPLVERRGRRVVLTDAGSEMVRCAHAALHALDDAEGRFAALRGLKTGRASVAVVSTARYFALRLVALFARQHADIELALDVQNRDTVMQLLLDGEVDLALMGTPPAHLETSAFPFARHPLVVIAASDHRLAGKRHVKATELARERFLVREPGSGTRAAMERFFAEHGIAPAERKEVPSNETIKQAVMAGLGLGFISQHAIGLELAAGELAVLRVDGLPIVRNWNVVHLTDRRLSPAAQAFKRFVLKEGRAFLAVWPRNA